MPYAVIEERFNTAFRNIMALFYPGGNRRIAIHNSPITRIALMNSSSPCPGNMPAAQPRDAMR